jgi:regulation of enolase protein 1 (concanavalin A-like superfamily)
MLSIAIPSGGTGHDVWTGSNLAPRILQTVNNGDFQTEVKFQSVLTAQFQMQGIIVEQDANTFLRFDFLRTNAGVQVFAASFTGGNATQRINTGAIGGSTNPLWLRVDRVGNNWTLSYSPSR